MKVAYTHSHQSPDKPPVFNYLTPKPRKSRARLWVVEAWFASYSSDGKLQWKTRESIKTSPCYLHEISELCINIWEKSGIMFNLESKEGDYFDFGFLAIGR